MFIFRSKVNIHENKLNKKLFLQLCNEQRYEFYFLFKDGD